MKLKTRMMLYIISSVTIIFILVTGYTINYSYKYAKDSANHIATLASIQRAQEIEKELNQAMAIARSLAYVFESEGSISSLDRGRANQIMKDVLNRKEDFLGVWTCWEPDAFDGNDSEFINVKGHDSTGRFIPYWHRVDEKIVLKPLLYYDIDGPDNYYLPSLRTGEEVVKDPYRYPIGDEEIYITSLVVPIFFNSKTVGVAGVDYSIHQLVEIATKENVYNSGELKLLSHNGMILSNDDLSSTEILEEAMFKTIEKEIVDKIKKGEVFSKYIFIEEKSEKALVTYVPIKIGDTKTPWSIVTIIPEKEILSEVNQMLFVTATISLLGIVFLVGLISYIARKIVAPIEQAIERAERIAKGDFSDTNNYIHKKDEIGKLEFALMNMEKKLKQSFEYINTQMSEIIKNSEELQEKDDELLLTNEKLRKTIFSLKEAKEEIEASQKYLIQYEKAKNLSIIVSGISHELKTPLGNAVTTISYFDRELNDFLNLAENNNITKRNLNEFTSTLSNTFKILTGNFTSALEIVESFKTIAIDQTSHKKKEFELCEYLNTLAHSLQTPLKKGNHQLIIQCNKFVLMNSYPGALSQVLTNLVFNSINHGFEDKVEGIIVISAQIDLDQVIITCSDNGRGIKQENLSKIYDAFYTTSEKKGGSGLGLQIVMNLVTMVLNGTIECESTEQEGTTFTFVIPNSVED